jgi:spore coat polysaccharide biosynthesis predicted glycosyltransferase SpsG
LVKKNKKWIVRVSSNPRVGGGHMMRSISLAISLKKYFDVHFVLDFEGESWISILNNKGFTAEIEGSKNNSTLIEQPHCVGVLIDSYDITTDEIFKWKNKCGKLAIIDDFGNAPDFTDFIISTGTLKKSKNHNKNQIIMTGPKYALLSNEYSNNGLLNPPSPDVRTILMSFGLYDSKNCTMLALDSLNKTNFKGKVQIAIGSKAPYLKDIKKIISSYIFSVEIFEDLYGLFDLHSNADLVMGAGGMSLLERMALGKPSITFIAADNQKKQVEWAESLGATISFSLNKNLVQSNIVESINSLLSDINLRNKMSKISSNAVDGKGVLRVSKTIMANI